MLTRYFRLAFVVLLFTQFFYASSMYAETPARLEIERVQRKFQGRWHAVHPLRFYGTDTYITWPKKSGSNIDPPNYPADGYYGSLSSADQVSLVQDIANKFWHTKCLTGMYIKAIDGLQEISYFDNEDMPDRSQNIVDLDSAYIALQAIEEHLSLFTRSPLPKACYNLEGGIASYTDDGGPTTDYFAIQMRAEQNIVATWPSDSSSKVFTTERTEVHNFTNSNWGSWSMVEGTRQNSYINCDFSDYNANSAVCYLKAKSDFYKMYENPADPGIGAYMWVSDNSPYSGDFPVAGNERYWAWAWTMDEENNPSTVILDPQWISPYLFTNQTVMFFCGVTFSTWEYVLGANGLTPVGTIDTLGGSGASWELTGTNIILELNFEGE